VVYPDSSYPAAVAVIGDRSLHVKVVATGYTFPSSLPANATVQVCPRVVCDPPRICASCVCVCVCFCKCVCEKENVHVCEIEKVCMHIYVCEMKKVCMHVCV
jgi:hypothetical protein